MILTYVDVQETDCGVVRYRLRKVDGKLFWADNPCSDDPGDPVLDRKVIELPNESSIEYAVKALMHMISQRSRVGMILVSPNNPWTTEEER